MTPPSDGFEIVASDDEDARNKKRPTKKKVKPKREPKLALYGLAHRTLQPKVVDISIDDDAVE